MSTDAKIFAMIVILWLTLAAAYRLGAQNTIPNGIQSIPLNPAGYCATQAGPSVNSVAVFSWCADASNGGTWYGAVSGQNFKPIAQGPPGPPPGKNCTSLKLNGVNADGTWNQTCTPGWQ